jgi:hypothetical protein
VRWGTDDKDLIYVGPDGRLVSVAIHVEPGGRALSPGVRKTLFQSGIINFGTAGPAYVVAGDGFLTTLVPQPTATPPMTVLLDWRPRR